MNLRRAKTNEVDVLNRLAIESESYWGEDENYMNLFTEKYKLTENMISICKEKGIRKIEFVGSNDVLEFYLKRGAKEVEKIESVLKIGRIVSRLEFEIT